jgi:lysozyme family protein
MTAHINHPHPSLHHPPGQSHKAHPPQHPKKKHPKHHKKTRPDYKNLFDTCVINPKKLGAIDAIATKIIHNRHRYEQLVQSVEGNIPGWFVGLVHNLEAGFSFDRHLHNGDPLTARTVHVPAGRPVHGNPPFTWEESAQDALRHDGLTSVTDWSVANAHFKLEGFNGYGYWSHGINSPYLWSCSNHYTKGKFVKDGVYDPNAVSHQAGSAVVLKRLVDRGAVVVNG